VNHSPNDGHNNSSSQSPPIISGKFVLRLLLEFLSTSRTCLLASHPEVSAKQFVTECAAFFGSLGSQTLENVVPEPHRALIESKSDIAAHSHPAEFFSIDQQPSLWLEWNELTRRSFLRERPYLRQFFRDSPEQHVVADSENSDLTLAKRFVEFNRRARSLFSY